MKEGFEQIPAENPIFAQWQLLAQYTYTPNIERYLQNKGCPTFNEIDIEFISGSIRQAEAYFSAARTSPLDVSPLLTYYGASNLLFGSAFLLYGTHQRVDHHGIKLIRDSVRSANRIGESLIKPVNQSSGALHYLCTVFSDGCLLVNGDHWTLSEILGSIPELKHDFEACYSDLSPFTIPVEIVKKRKKPFERVRKSELLRFSDIDELVSRIPGYSSNYLRPLWQGDGDFVIMYRKLDSSDVGVYSTYGQKFLQIAHAKNGNMLVPSQLILFFMGLYALGTLNRYYPERWNSFAQRDGTGERLLVEKFLGVCQRAIPNLVLNEIYGKQVRFVRHLDGVFDLERAIEEDDIKSF